MKTKDVAKQYGLDLELFEKFLYNSQYNAKVNLGLLGGYTIDNSLDIDKIVTEFKQFEADKPKREIEAAEQRAALERATIEKSAALASMLITSGFNFDGYTITKYSEYISGDDAISVDRGMTIFGQGVNIKDELLGTLVEIRRNALTELKEAAYALGCNAVIGVDFDYLTLDPQTANLTGGTTYQPYVFAVTANGNAVVIEKNE